MHAQCHIYTDNVYTDTCIHKHMCTHTHTYTNALIHSFYMITRSVVVADIKRKAQYYFTLYCREKKRKGHVLKENYYLLHGNLHPHTYAHTNLFALPSTTHTVMHIRSDAHPVMHIHSDVPALSTHSDAHTCTQMFDAENQTLQDKTVQDGKKLVLLESTLREVKADPAAMKQIFERLHLLYYQLDTLTQSLAGVVTVTSQEPQPKLSDRYKLLLDYLFPCRALDPRLDGLFSQILAYATGVKDPPEEIPVVPAPPAFAAMAAQSTYPWAISTDAPVFVRHVLKEEGPAETLMRQAKLEMIELPEYTGQPRYPGDPSVPLHGFNFDFGALKLHDKQIRRAVVIIRYDSEKVEDVMERADRQVGGWRMKDGVAYIRSERTVSDVPPREKGVVPSFCFDVFNERDVAKKLGTVMVSFVDKRTVVNMETYPILDDSESEIGSLKLTIRGSPPSATMPVERYQALKQARQKEKEEAEAAAERAEVEKKSEKALQEKAQAMIAEATARADEILKQALAEQERIVKKTEKESADRLKAQMEEVNKQKEIMEKAITAQRDNTRKEVEYLQGLSKRAVEAAGTRSPYVVDAQRKSTDVGRSSDPDFARPGPPSDIGSRKTTMEGRTSDVDRQPPRISDRPEKVTEIRRPSETELPKRTTLRVDLGVGSRSSSTGSLAEAASKMKTTGFSTLNLTQGFREKPKPAAKETPLMVKSTVKEAKKPGAEKATLKATSKAATLEGIKTVKTEVKRPARQAEVAFTVDEEPRSWKASDLRKQFKAQAQAQAKAKDTRKGAVTKKAAEAPTAKPAPEPPEPKMEAPASIAKKATDAAPAEAPTKALLPPEGKIGVAKSAAVSSAPGKPAPTQSAPVKPAPAKPAAETAKTKTGGTPAPTSAKAERTKEGGKAASTKEGGKAASTKAAAGKTAPAKSAAAEPAGKPPKAKVSSGKVAKAAGKSKKAGKAPKGK